MTNKFQIFLFVIFCSGLQSRAIILKDTIDLETVIVSARSLDKTDPLVVQLVGRESIENVYIGQDMSVLLEQLSPSIISYSDAGSDMGNYVQFRMRGMDQTRINTTLNGIPLNDMIDQGVYFSNFTDLGSSLKNIQIQRGVGVTNGGVASYAGAINFDSEGIFDQLPSAEFQLTSGSFKTLRASGTVKTGILENKFGLYSRFSRLRSDGYKDHSGSDAYSLFISGGYKGKKDVLTVTALAGKTENDQSYLPVLLKDIRRNPVTNYNHPNDRDNFEQELVHLRYSRYLSDNLSMSTSLYYGGARGFFPFGLDDQTQLVYGIQNDHFGALSEWRLNTDKVNLSTGFHAYTFKRKNENYTAPNSANPDYKDRSKKEEFSLFGKFIYRLGAMSLLGDIHLRSVRLNFIANEILSYGGPVPPGGIDHRRTWLFINPKIGLGYEVTDHSSLYTTFGRTSREPTRTDILQGDGSAINEFNYYSAIDESLVKEEYVYDWELGYRYNSGKSNLDVNLFYMDFTNEISLVGALAERSYVPLRQNIPKSTRAGLELTYSYKPSSKVDLRLNASYLFTSVEAFNNGTDEYRNVSHIFAPKWVLSPSIDYNISDRWTFQIHSRYVSESFMELSNDRDFLLEPYMVLNTKLDFSISKNWQLRLMINNLFDQLYFNDGAPVDLDYDGNVEGPGFRIQPPRSFYIQIKFTI